ncbi:MAG: TIGR02444 family protein [Geminicoccaceae bacterium]
MTAAPPWPDCAFWDFSLALYSRPGIEAACLKLQDEFGLDVNLVLLAAWTASRGMQIEPDLAARLRSIGEGYQTMVMRNFRAARRGLKCWPEAAALGNLVAAPERRLRAVELDLERLEQLRLAGLVEGCRSVSGRGGTDLFKANLEALYPGLPLPEMALATFVAAVAEHGQTQPSHSSQPDFP